MQYIIETEPTAKSYPQENRNNPHILKIIGTHSKNMLHSVVVVMAYVLVYVLHQ